MRDAKQLAPNSAIREMAMSFDRKLTPVMIRVKLRNEGILASYINCVNALDRFEVKFSGSDTERYGLLPSYVAELKNRSHNVELDIVENEFKRLSIIFREGIQAFGKYSERGISVDSTFLKTSVGGIFLVACFRNGNNEF